MTNPSTKPARNNGKMSWAQACRDIVVTSMNRGQLPILGMIAIVLVLVWKLPEEKATELIFSIFHALQEGALIGYVLFIATVAGWYFHSKWMRKMFSEEAKRIGKEESGLQSALTGDKFPSSNRKARRSK